MIKIDRYNIKMKTLVFSQKIEDINYLTEFLYLLGDLPLTFLNIFENINGLSYPTEREISPIDNCLSFIISFYLLILKLIK